MRKFGLFLIVVLLFGLLPAATAAQLGRGPSPALVGLTLTPESQQGTTTCWDAEAYYTFELTNDTGVDSFFDITVSALFPTTCPAQVYAAAGETVSFECSVGVPLGGVTDTATIAAGGQGYSDSATVTTLVDRTGEWAAQPPSPFATQYSPVISWDGRLYVMGMDDDDRGVPPDGQVLIWDGTAWALGAVSGHYTTVDTDACLGLDAAGDPVIDLLSSQPYGGVFPRYNIDSDTWTTTPAPPGYPSGINNAEIVSMLQHTGQNLCYITGGWSYSGIPYYSPLYAYDPAAQTWTSLGSFTYAAANLQDHFAWYVPWVEGGAICIAGGRTWQDTPPYDMFYADSQCYVLGTGLFHAPNADLGPLPEPWHAGGDAWRENDGRYEIWGSHGMDVSRQTLTSFYAAPGQPFAYGPAPAHDFLASEGDNYGGSIWAANGSTQGFWSSTLVESLELCPASCVAPSGAGFSRTPSAPTILEPVTFTAARPAGTGPRTYSWDFGDGATATGRTAHHTYIVPGDYTVTLTVSNECGATQEQETVTVIGVPDIVLTPTSLEQTLEPETQAQQTLSVCNEGTEPLTWILTEAPGTKAVTPALSGAERGSNPHPASPAASGEGKGELALPLSSKLPPASGVASQPIHPDAVLWEQLPESTYSIYSDLWADPGLALWTSDDFENAEMWQIDTIHVPGGLASGSLANALALHWCLYPDAGGAPAGDPFVGGEAWCWSTQPTDPAVTIGGGMYGADVTLDVLAGQGAPLSVPAGHWWLLFYPEFPTFPSDVFAVLLTETTNLAFAHFLDPIDYLGFGLTSWTPMSDLGANADMAFRLEGIEVTYDILWLDEDPASGMVLPGECAEVTATFSAAGLAPGGYTGALYIYSNDPDTPQATVPVELTVELPGPRIAVSPASLVAEQCPDTQTTQPLGICSTGSEDVTWSLAEAIDWLSMDLASGTLPPGECDQVMVTFDSTTLWPDSFFDVFFVDSNDPNHPQVQVPAELTVWAPPSGADFSWAPPSPVVGEVVTFTGTAQGSEPLDYTWAFGDGGGGGGATVEHTFAAAGDHLVTLTVSNACDGAVVQKVVHVYAGPALRIEPALLSARVCQDTSGTAPVQVCNDGDLALDWLVETAPNWVGWTPSSGTVLAGLCQPVESFFDSAGLPPGIYSDTIHGRWQVDSFFDVFVEMTVKEPVHGAAFTWSPVEPLAGLPVTFQATTEGTGPFRFEWDFGDGSTGLGPEVTHIYPAPGEFLPRVTVTDADGDCGSDSVQHLVQVYGGPEIEIDPMALSATVCGEDHEVQSLQVCNLGDLELSWSAAEGLSWLTVSPTAGTLGPGECQSVDADFFGPGSDPFQDMVVFSSNDPDEPAVNVAVSLTVLEVVHDAGFSWTPASPYAGQRVTFTGTAQGSGPIHYTWGFDPGIRTLPEANPVTYRFTAAGEYLVSMGAWNACGGQFVHHTVAVAPAPSKTHVNWIRMSYVDRGLGRYAVVGKVQIVDAARAAVPGATVHAEWTAPNGATTAQQTLTNVTGLAAFKVPTMQTGIWHLCVTDVVLAGWVYDPAANGETCDTVTIP